MKVDFKASEPKRVIINLHSEEVSLFKADLEDLKKSKELRAVTKELLDRLTRGF